MNTCMSSSTRGFDGMFESLGFLDSYKIPAVPQFAFTDEIASSQVAQWMAQINLEKERNRTFMSGDIWTTTPDTSELYSEPPPPPTPPVQAQVDKNRKAKAQTKRDDAAAKIPTKSGPATKAERLDAVEEVLNNAVGNIEYLDGKIEGAHKRMNELESELAGKESKGILPVVRGMIEDESFELRRQIDAIYPIVILISTLLGGFLGWAAGVVF